MSKKILQLNEGAIKNELKELVRGSVEEILEDYGFVYYVLHWSVPYVFRGYAIKTNFGKQGRGQTGQRRRSLKRIPPFFTVLN